MLLTQLLGQARFTRAYLKLLGNERKHVYVCKRPGKVVHIYVSMGLIETSPLIVSNSFLDVGFWILVLQDMPGRLGFGRWLLRDFVVVGGGGLTFDFWTFDLSLI
jgi:hypothetical protein